jgi:AhpD family alkylhydroperoxidase
MKGLQMNPHTALSGKDKELIGLAVAAQIPCDYCIYFHSMAAQKAGASQQEVQEAVSMAALTRHWSTILNGSQMDRQAFRQETDQMLAHVSQQAQVGSDKTPVDRKSSP